MLDSRMQCNYTKQLCCVTAETQLGKLAVYKMTLYKGIDWGWRYRNLICLNIYHMCKYISTVFFGNHIVPGFIIIPFTAHIYFKLTLFVASKKMVHIEKWPTGYSTSLVSILLFYVNCLIMKKGLYSAVNLWTTESVPSQRWDTVRDKWIFYTLWIYPCGALLTLF